MGIESWRTRKVYMTTIGDIGGVIRKLRVEYAIETVRYFNSCVVNSWNKV